MALFYFFLAFSIVTIISMLWTNHIEKKYEHMENK